MYYSDEIVDEVRSRVNIVDVIGNYVALKKKGANYFGLCPFHGEKTASFSVAPGKQIFYCFGCGKGGDAVRFLMDYENITFQEALKRLADQVGYTLPESGPSGAAQRQESDIRGQLLEINKAAALYFYGALKTKAGEIGLRYLRGRELRDDTITHWGLGYAGQTRDGLYQYLRQKGFSDALLRESGLFSFSERGVYDKFFNRVMFPIMDYNNRVIGFGGRVMGDGEPKYLNSPETRLFDKSRNLFGLNFARKARKPYMILCEGYMDVISMHQAGFQCAVASLGTSLTENQARLLKRYVNEVLLTYDSDNAGVKAARRAIPILRAAGIESKVINVKPHKDPDEFIKAEGAEKFQERIDQAKNSFLWEAEAVKRSYDLQDPAGQTAYVNELAEMLCRFREPLEQENYMKAVSREQMIDYSGLRRLVLQKMNQQNSPFQKKMYAQTDYFDRPERGKKKEPETAVQKSERQLITWLSEKPEIIELVKRYIREEDISDEICRKVLGMVYARQPVNQILDSFREDEEAYQRVVAMFNGNLLPEDTSEADFKRGLADIIRNIRLQALNAQIEAETDGQKLTALFKEQSELENLQL